MFGLFYPYNTVDSKLLTYCQPLTYDYVTL